MRSLLFAGLLVLAGCANQNTATSDQQQGQFNQADAAKTRISLGLTYLKNGNYQQAKFNLDKALQFAPEMADAHFSLGYYYQLVGEEQAASASYAKAMKLAPDNADIANSYGAFLCQTGDYQGAKTYFLKAINNPNYIRVAESYENLALCAQKEGRAGDTLVYLQQALKHDPGRTRSTILLLQTLIEQQQWQQADELLGRYEKMGAVNATTLWMRTQIEQGMGNSQKAQGYARMLVQMFPEHPNTQAALRLVSQTPETAAQVTPIGKVEAPANQPQSDAVAQQAPQQLTRADERTQPASELAATPEPVATDDVHVVQRGENLYRISLRYNIKMQSLIEWNQLPASGEVKLGQRLKLTAPDK